MIEGKLVTTTVGGFFRIFEVFFRTIHVTVRGIRLLVQRFLTAPVDAVLSQFGKRRVAERAEIDHDSIVLIAMQGEYTCNPKYIAQEIVRRELPYKITWVLRGQSVGPYPGTFQFVAHDSVEYFQAVASAKVVVQNGHSLQRTRAYKGPSQYWLQTWHGSLGLKRLEGAGGDQKFYETMRKLDNEQTDIVLTNSVFEDDVFTNTYWPDVQKLKLGHARNDVLFDKSKKTADDLRKKVLDRLGIADEGQKFLLYAPTHDDNSQSTAMLSGLDLTAVRSTLADKFGGDWEILIRTHNTNKRVSDAMLAGLPAYCHNASFYPDMQELLVVAEAGISDYSSWVCDFILTNKPAFLYSSDLTAYSEKRGFYHDFDDTPFTMATSNQKLLKNMAKFDQEDYDNGIEAFLEMCGSIDDGKASSRIVDKIEELMAF